MGKRKATDRKMRVRKSGQGGCGRSSFDSSLVPRIHLERHTYFQNDTILLRCGVANEKSVRIKSARVQLVNARGRVAHDSDVSAALGQMGRGQAQVTISSGDLSPGGYTAVLLVESESYVAGATAEVLVVRDNRKEHLSARNYIHSPLPLTNYLDDIDRVLLAYRRGNYNYLIRTSWARETSAAQITDDYKLLPYHVLHADHLGRHAMAAEIEFTSAGAAPESRNPRVQKAGAMEYAISEEGVGEREVTEGPVGEEEFERLQRDYRKGINWQGQESGICPQDETLLQRRELVYRDILEKHFDKPGMGNVNLAHKPGTARFPSCFCERCQQEYREFLKQLGYKAEQFGKRRWSEVRMPPPEAFQVDESKVDEHLASLGVTRADADASGEVLWVGVPGKLGRMTGYAQDYRDLMAVGVKIKPREWVALNLYSGYQLAQELKRLKDRVLARQPDFWWGVEMAHPSVELGSNLTMMGGNAWSLSPVVDYLSISAGLCGPGLWYDGYFNCYCAEVLSAALDYQGPVGVTLHQDELGVLGLRIDSGNLYDLAPEQFKEWVATCIAHGAEGIGMDNCSTPHQIWMYDGSCPSGHNEVGPSFALLETVNEAVGPSLRRAYGQRTEIAILYGYSRLLRYASSDTHQGFKFLHRGFGGGGVSFVQEAQILKGALKHVRALFIFGDGQCVDEDLVEAIQDWVRSGGLLVADVHTGKWDRDFAERNWFQKLFGCREGQHPEASEVTIRSAAPAERGRKMRLLPMEEYERLPSPERSAGKVRPSRVRLDADEDAEVLAQWEDGSPAIVSHRYGRGKAILAGFFLGQEVYYLSEEHQDCLSRLMAAFCYEEAVTPPGFSDNLNYEVGVRDAGEDVKYAIFHPHIPQWRWRPRQEMLLHSWMERDPHWENLPQMRYRPVTDPLPAQITFRGGWQAIDALTGETTPVRAAHGNTRIKESLSLGEMRAVILLRRKPTSIRVEPVRKRVQKESKAVLRISFLDREGRRVAGCLPFRLSVLDSGGEHPEFEQFTSTERNGLATLEVVIGADAEPGTWTVIVESPTLGLSSRTRFQVMGRPSAAFQLEEQRVAEQLPVDTASVKMARGKLIMENGLVRAVISPGSMTAEMLDKRTGRTFTGLGEYLTSDLVDANQIRRLSPAMLSRPSRSSIRLEARGPVRVQVMISNWYGGDLLQRHWVVELDAGNPCLKVRSTWIPKEPLGIADGEFLSVGAVKTAGRLTTVESFMESWQNVRVENYKVFQGAPGEDASVEYLVSQTPTLPPSSDWGKPTPMDAGYNIYPQRVWYDLSTGDSGITVLAAVDSAVDAVGTRIEEFGAIGFKKILYEDGRGGILWPGRFYPTIAKSVPRKTICYERLSFDYLFGPHAGGCPDLAGRIPDMIPVGQLPPHDLHLSLLPSGEHRGLLIAPGDVREEDGLQVQAVNLVEGLGVPRNGIVVSVPRKGLPLEVNATWNGMDVPTQWKNGCVICSIPTLEANGCGQLVVSARVEE